MHIVALHGSEMTDLIREGLLFLLCIEASIMQFNRSVVVLDFTVYTRVFMYPKYSSPKEFGQVTLVAKQPDPVT
jgi:hypothetical protein